MEGSGTKNAPYIINNVADWKAINNDMTAYYELGDNIDCSGEDVMIDGGGDTFFSGHLDGKGYYLENVTVNVPDFVYDTNFEGIGWSGTSAWLV